MLKIGDRGTFEKTITETDLSLFVGISGDFNPLHVSEEAAKKTIYGERIVHGMLSASLISTVIGMYMPGPGAIYLEQDCKFLKPVKLGDTLTAEVIFSEIINREKGILRLEDAVYNQKNECVIKGYSIVKVDSALLE